MYEIKRRKPGRHWFALLTCLLLLSLIAPSLWDDGRNPFGFEASQAPPLDAGLSHATSPYGKAKWIAAHPERPVTIVAASTAVTLTGATSTGTMTTETGVAPDSASSNSTNVPLAAVVSPIEPAIASFVRVEPPSFPTPAVSALLPRVKIDAFDRRGFTSQYSNDLSLDPAPSISRSDGWPLPAVLLEQLDALTEVPSLAPWAFDVIGMIEELNQISLIDNHSADLVLTRLEAATDGTNELAEEAESPEAQSQMRRTAYAMSRRLATWKLSNSVFTLDVLAAVDGLKPKHNRLAMLDFDITELGQTSLPVLPGKPFHRLDSRPLILQAEPYQNESSLPLAPHAFNGMDRVKNLLVTLERYEATRLPRDGHTVARHIMDLASSSEPARQELAKHLDDHYRNANFRINVTNRFFDELLPKLKPQEGEIDDWINGVPISGWQETVAHLYAELVEDANQIHLRIGVKGDVTSDTEANSGPATLYSVGQTDYNVGRDVIVSPRGLAMTPTRGHADAYSSLTGVATDYDGVFLFGPFVEKIARRKYDEQKYQAMAQVEQRVADEASQQFDKEFTPKIIDAARKFHANFWTPLVGLGLDPTAVEMFTTTKRMVARHRLAAADQLAAHTARPQAPSDSWLSMQMHESMLNNSLDLFDVNGKTFTLPELHRHISKRLGQPDAEAPAELDKRVKIAFAKEDAVRVRCEQGAVELTLSLAELSRGKKHRWTNIVVKARYQPEGTGLQANLARQTGIELIGDKLRAGDQIALRGVFSKLLSRSRYAVLVPDHIAGHEALESLEVTQFQIKDGWVAVAIGPRLATPDESDESTARVPRWRLGQKDHADITR